MKLKYHLWIAFGIIVVAIFLTSVVSATAVPALGVDKESTTTIWNLMWENLFTTIPTDDVTDALAGLGITGSVATGLIDEHGTGNSVLSGILGLIPILATLTGVVLVLFKEKLKCWALHIPYAVVLVSVWTIWFTAPTKLTGVESMYNSLSALGVPVPATMGTMMSEGTEITMAIGLFIASLGAIYGIVALVLNKFDKIPE